MRYDWPTQTLGLRLGDACNAGGAALAYLDRERKVEEAKRLLYVAATRAEEVLLMTASAEAKGDTWIGLLEPEFEGRVKVTRRTWSPPSAPKAVPLPEKERPDWPAFVARWREREKRYRVVDPFTSPSALEAYEKPAGLVSRMADIGTECHKVLEHLDFKAPRVPKGTGGESTEILETFFKSAPFRELAGAEILARELPFVLPRDGRVVSGVIDVIYRAGGKVWVADYKTDKIVEPEKYGLIRDFYVEAARRALGVEPVFKLLYLRYGKGVKL